MNLLAFVLILGLSHSYANALSTIAACGRGDPSCATLLCAPNNVTRHNYQCVFAPLDKTATNYIARNGAWDGNNLFGLNIKESNCSEADCCVTNVPSSAVSSSKFELGMQFYTSPTKTHDVSVRIDVTYCDDFNNADPNRCLNLPSLCSSVTTTRSLDETTVVKSTVAMVTTVGTTKTTAPSTTVTTETIAQSTTVTTAPSTIVPAETTTASTKAPSTKKTSSEATTSQVVTSVLPSTGSIRSTQGSSSSMIANVDAATAYALPSIHTGTTDITHNYTSMSMVTLGLIAFNSTTGKAQITVHATTIPENIMSTTTDEQTTKSSTIPETMTPTTLYQKTTTLSTTNPETTTLTTSYQKITTHSTTNPETTTPTTSYQKTTTLSTTNPETTTLTTSYQEITTHSTTNPETTTPTTSYQKTTTLSTTNPETTTLTTSYQEITTHSTTNPETTTPTTSYQKTTTLSTTNPETTTLTTSYQEITTHSTTNPETTTPTTSYQKTTTLSTTNPETTTLTTSYQEITTHSTTNPETTTPTTSYQKNTTLSTTNPETTTLTTSYQETTTHITTNPETTTPTTSYQETTKHSTTNPETTTPTISYQETTKHSTTIPETITPTKSYQETTTLSTTIPETMTLTTSNQETTTASTTIPEITTTVTVTPTTTIFDTTASMINIAETTLPITTIAESVLATTSAAKTNTQPTTVVSNKHTTSFNNATDHTTVLHATDITTADRAPETWRSTSTDSNPSTNLTDSTTPNPPQQSTASMPRTDPPSPTAFATTPPPATNADIRSTLANITNPTIFSIREVLGLSGDSERIEVADLTVTQEGTFSSSFFSGLSVNPASVSNVSKVGFVAEQYAPRKNAENLALQEQNGEYSTEFSYYPDSPFLNIIVVDLERGREVEASSLSYIISVNTTFNRRTISALAPSNSRIKQVSARCGFFNATSVMGSTNGCRMTASNSTSVSCHCDHTTLFAVLLSVQTYNIPPAVKIISYVTESISILSLVVAIAILVTVRRKVRSDRTVVQINLSCALVCFHVFALFQDVALESKHACEFVAVATHFFLLATGTWMLWEGLTLFIKTTDKILSLNKKNPRKVALVKLLLGWGIPLLIVVLAVAIGFPTKRYMDESESPQYQAYLRCWVGNAHNALLASVIIPMAAIYLANVIIAARVIWFVHKLRSNARELKPSSGVHHNVGEAVKKDAENVAATLKAFLLLLPVLGIPLIFAFLTSVEPYEASVAFMYINVITNGLQGFFLLLVYCVFGTEVREASLRVLQRLKFRYMGEQTASHVQSKETPSTHSTNTGPRSENKV